MNNKNKKIPKNLKNYIKCLCIKCPTSNICMKIRFQKLFCIDGPTKCRLDAMGCLCPECPVAKKYGLQRKYYCEENKEKEEAIINLKLIEKIKETENTFTFIFKPPEEINWNAGQYIFYRIPHKDPDERGIERHFTISSAPFEKNVMLTTRFDFQNGSSFKEALFGLNIGDTVESYDLEGDFIIKDFDDRFVLIAGGVGITPYRSIVLDMINKNKSPDTVLFYCNRDNNIIFKELFDKVEKENDWLKINYIIEPELISRDIIEDKVPDLKSRKYYVSGSRKFVDIVNDILTDLKIDPGNIVKDFFPGY